MMLQRRQVAAIGCSSLHEGQITSSGSAGTGRGGAGGSTGNRQEHFGQPAVVPAAGILAGSMEAE